MGFWDTIKHFEPMEFEDPLNTGSGLYIDHALVLMLDDLRERTGWPIIAHWKVGGCVDVGGSHGHEDDSYHLLVNKCKAVDFHFDTSAPTREQYHEVSKQGFTGIGVYYCWKWNGKQLPIAFHADRRPINKTQRWSSRKKGKLQYLL